MILRELMVVLAPVLTHHPITFVKRLTPKHTPWIVYTRDPHPYRIATIIRCADNTSCWDSFLATTAVPQAGDPLDRFSGQKLCDAEIKPNLDFWNHSTLTDVVTWDVRCWHFKVYHEIEQYFKDVCVIRNLLAK